MLDHTKFVTQYETHKASRIRQKFMQQKTLYAAVAVSCVFGMFIGIFAYLVIFASIDQNAQSIASIALISCIVLAFFTYRLFRFYIRHEQQYNMMDKIFSESRSARLITNAKGDTVFANSKLKELCGAGEKTLIENLENLFGESHDSVQKFQWLKKRAVDGHEDTIDIVYKKKQIEKWFRILAQPVLDDVGTVHWSIDDITHQYKHDRAIREEREKLIDFSDHAPVGFFSLDENGQFVFVNATLARWLGRDLNKLINHDGIHAYLVDLPKDAKPYDIVDGGGARQVTEMRMKGAAGQTFLASINQTVVHEANGIVRTRGIVHDLTAERDMRRALKASQDRFETFFTEAPIGIVQLDKSRAIVDCNQSFANMMGVTQSKIDGRNFITLLKPDKRKDIVHLLKRVESGHDVKFPIELTFDLKKSMLTVQMFARELADDDTIVLHLINVTEKKVLEQQFVQSQKMQAIGQLAGGIAHDFNNLLTAIIGFCDLLLLRHKPGDSSFADIMQIKQNSNRAANLVRQLLAFSRQQTLRVKVHDITDILIELSHLLRRLIGAGIEFELSHGRDLGLVKIDEGQMEQVLINLAVNARDAMDGKGELSIVTENYTNTAPQELVSEELPAGEWVMISVTDKGCGIDKDNMSRIFEPFFTTKDVGEGTGLGLATVYGIIRQSDGYLDVKSKRGEGTTFSIYLPQSAEDENEAVIVPEKTKHDVKDLTGSECILLVEDEDAVRTFSTRALTNKGYDVLVASSGEDALQVLQDNPDREIDLVVTDVFMPGMDGPTLVQRLRQTNSDLKVIFISGYTEDKLKDHLGQKDTHFIPKPYTLKVLAEKVKDVLAE